MIALAAIAGVAALACTIAGCVCRQRYWRWRALMTAPSIEGPALALPRLARIADAYARASSAWLIAGGGASFVFAFAFAALVRP